MFENMREIVYSVLCPIDNTLFLKLDTQNKNGPIMNRKSLDPNGLRFPLKL